MTLRFPFRTGLAGWNGSGRSSHFWLALPPKARELWIVVVKATSLIDMSSLRVALQVPSLKTNPAVEVVDAGGDLSVRPTLVAEGTMSRRDPHRPRAESSCPIASSRSMGTGLSPGTRWVANFLRRWRL